MAEDSVPDLSRPQMYLFGCVLRSDKREFRVEAEEDEADHQLSLKAVCLGADAEDKFHTVEIEGVTYDGKTTRVPLAVLKPSVLPSMSLGGFEITPPVTFRLQSGCGPVYISGQHFVSVKDSEEEEEENNSSPVKRPSSMASGKQSTPKKLKMESDDNDDDEDEDDSDEDDEDDDEDDDDDDDSDEDVKKSSAPKPVKKSPEVKKVTFASKQNGSPGKPGPSAAKPQTKALAAGRSGGLLTVPEVRTRLAAHAKEGKPFPRTEQKFENFAKSSFKISDKKVVKDLWSFVQTLKTEQK